MTHQELRRALLDLVDSRKWLPDADLRDLYEAIDNTHYWLGKEYQSRRSPVIEGEIINA